LYLNSVKKKVIYFRKIKKILKKNNLSFLLFNRTLLCAETVSLLSHDNYDDIVVDIKILEKKKLIKDLNKIFKIKIKKNCLVIFYEKFTINMYFINFKQKYLNYNGLNVETKNFKKIKKIKIMNTIFNIPLDSKIIFNKLFVPSNAEIISSSVLNINKSFIKRIKNLVIAMLYILLFQKKYPRYDLNQRILTLYNLNFFNFIKSGLNKFRRKKIFKLNYSSFKNLNFDPIEYNWFFRKKHYSLIIRNSKQMKVKDIIKFLKNKKIDKIKNKIIETKMNKPFEEPIYLNQKFWKTGNNFFIYPIIYGFKKNVVGYQKVNQYIIMKKKPEVYSKGYYKKLKNMNDTEIRKYLHGNPLPINKLGFISGRHRVAAMIGRILKGEKYIPFNVYKV